MYKYSKNVQHNSLLSAGLRRSFHFPLRFIGKRLAHLPSALFVRDERENKRAVQSMGGVGSGKKWSNSIHVRQDVRRKKSVGVFGRRVYLREYCGRRFQRATLSTCVPFYLFVFVLWFSFYFSYVEACYCSCRVCVILNFAIRSKIGRPNMPAIRYHRFVLNFYIVSLKMIFKSFLSIRMFVSLFFFYVATE